MWILQGLVLTTFIIRQKGIFSAKTRDVKVVDTQAPVIELDEVPGYYLKPAKPIRKKVLPLLTTMMVILQVKLLKLNLIM